MTQLPRGYWELDCLYNECRGTRNVMDTRLGKLWGKMEDTEVNI